MILPLRNRIWRLKRLKNLELSHEALPDNQGLAWKWKAFPLLQLRRQHDQLYDLVFLNPTLLQRCQASLTSELSAWMQQEQAEIRLLEPPASPLWRAAMLNTGLTYYQKYFYSRALSPDSFPSSAPFHLESLAELGEAAFLADLELISEGDPENASWGVRGWNAQKEFEQLKAHADTAFDPQRWFRVSRLDSSAAEPVLQPIGLILPQVYPDKPNEGTLFYLGVFPALRQQKYGQALHHLGLQLLAQAGVTRYVGSTDVRNGAMQRIFAKNDCEQTRLLTFFQTLGGR
jgi:RimJ/RimL family protein N-acetyltransferase